MAFHLIVTCVAQKTVRKSVSILDSSIDSGSLEEVFAQWQSKLNSTDLQKKSAIDLYNSGLWGTYLDSWGVVNGRVKDANLWVLSAGHGLINANEKIVPYDVTFQDPRNDVPSILGKIEYNTASDARKKVLQGWWKKLSERKGEYSNSLTRLFSGFTSEDYALVVLGKDYLDAVFSDLKEGITASPYSGNIAVISNNVNDPTARKLESNWLYANSRLVNLPRSNATFVNAKIAHNLLLKMFEQEGGIGWWSFDSFNRYLEDLCADLPVPQKHERVLSTDAEIKSYIEGVLRKQDIPFSRLHRQFRDEGKACEYSRFKGLYYQVKDELKKETLTKRPSFPVHHEPRQAKMLFFLPDWDDRVDPFFDFDRDVPFPNRDPYEHDTYHYELYGHLNCDGILVSKSVLEDNKEKLKRIKRKGIHKHLRIPKNVPVLADCGAFNYIMAEDPPYETEETLDFYQDLGFNYGVSIDHLIVPGILQRTKYYQHSNGKWEEIDSKTFDARKKEEHVKVVRKRNAPLQTNLYIDVTLLCQETYVDEKERERRYLLTINNAKDFIERHQKGDYTFTPIGSVQGWDPGSYADAVKLYQDMGYDYLALGGLVRSTTREIIAILDAVSVVKKPSTRIHIFGVARLDAIEAFMEHGVTSVDSAGPLRQAWLSSSSNYHWTDGNHYTAIRIPPADKGAKVKKVLEQGLVSHNELLSMEQECRAVLRTYDQNKSSVSLENVMEKVIAYHNMMDGKPNLEGKYRRTLQDKPWKACPCAVCQEVGIEVVVFRRNNRNRRRGFHNIWVFYNKFKSMTTR